MQLQMRNEVYSCFCLYFWQGGEIMILSRELIYLSQRYFWRWVSFSQGGICDRSLEGNSSRLQLFFGHRLQGLTLDTHNLSRQGEEVTISYLSAGDLCLPSLERQKRLQVLLGQGKRMCNTISIYIRKWNEWDKQQCFLPQFCCSIVWEKSINRINHLLFLQNLYMDCKSQTRIDKQIVKHEAILCHVQCSS